MKLVRTTADGSVTALKTVGTTTKPTLAPWKVLIVDDETDIHTITRLALEEFRYIHRPLQILQALSCAEAREILSAEPDIAVALIDVVMETDDAGLQLIEFIRNQLKYSLIRLIIRTGQPGMAPEREVIERYDIDDYKSKTELRADRLYTTMRMALKSYHDLLVLDSNRRALRKILEAVPEFHHASSFTQFFNGVLSQLIGLCNLGENSCIATVNSGLVITTDNHQHVTVQAGTGDFTQLYQNPKVEAIRTLCSSLILDKSSKVTLPDNALLVPIEIKQKPVGFVYLEDTSHLNSADSDLIQIMVHQCATALENLQLYLQLQEALQKTSEMLKLAEIANQAKTAFLANVSHELRTPLNSILGHVQILRRDPQLLPKHQKSLDAIHCSGEHLLTLVSDILDISKLQTEKLELQPTDVRLSVFLTELTNWFRDQAQGKGLNFCYEPAPHLPTGIVADNKRLRQILLHLLSNAVKFTQFGRITFQVHSIPLPERPNWHQFQFTVTDTGIGMTEDHLSKLFVPFEKVSDWRHKSAGTGLGLSLTKRLVELMEGQIQVHSQLGEGSTFIVKLNFPESQEWQEEVSEQFKVTDILETDFFPLKGPSADQAAKLYNLSQMGDFMGIVKLITELEQEDEELKPFANKVRELARNYRDELIEELAKQFLGTVSPET